MRTPIPICAGTTKWRDERNKMGPELAKKFDDDNDKHLHDMLQAYNNARAAKQADGAQKAAEEIVFGF